MGIVVCLSIEPRFEDQEIAVYRMTPIAGQDFGLAFELMPGLGVIRTTLSSPCIRPAGVLNVDVAWGTSTAPGQNLNVELALASPEGPLRHSTGHPIAVDWPSRDWPANSVVWGHYSTRAPDDLPQGMYDVVLQLSDPETGLAFGQEAVIDRVTVGSATCVLAVPEGAVGVNARFGDAMRLLGYRLDRMGGNVELTLYWRPERRMEADYKVFVHVFPPGTGIPVAQDDAMPLQWRYPTSYWSLDEMVTDVLSISMEQVPPGEYGVAVGVYDPATGERLPVWDSSDNVLLDGRLVFPGEMVRVER